MSILISEGLNYAFEEYGMFLGDHSMWGRDYVAMALLATPDPSLQELAEEAGTTVKDLRDAWGRLLFEGVGGDAAARLEYWVETRRTDQTLGPTTLLHRSVVTGVHGDALLGVYYVLSE